ncbi:MAG: helix-hairpin-helix domain-containing protein [Candidatus Thorarchaeota archaeon]
MTSIMNVANSLGKATTQKLKQIGIDSLEKLASSRVEDLLAIEDIGLKRAKEYIQFAKNHIQNIKAREKIYNIINKGITSDTQKSTNNQNISKSSVNRNNLRIPISSIKEIASLSIEDLSKTKGMDPSEAQRYIKIAKKYLESMRKEEIPSSEISTKTKKQDPLLGFVKFENKTYVQNLKPRAQLEEQKQPQLEKPLNDFTQLKKPTLKIKPLLQPTIDLKSTTEPSKQKKVEKKLSKVEIKKQPELQTFFTPTTMQKIRFLHFKIKTLEEALEKNQDFSFSELNNILEYIKILNVNYKTQSQIRIFKDLEITPSFYDPGAKKEIKIWDLIFECSRVLWIAAKTYSYLSNKFEEDNLMENAIVAMVECSKMYKTAAYFSAACTRQEDKGLALSVENLELNSEEARILAQNLATISEERKGNFAMAANLSSGLSALTKRLAFLRKYDEKKENHFRAQYNYDMGRACHLKAKSLLKVSPEGENEEQIENLQKKANYYYDKAEEIWEYMLSKSSNLTASEEESIRTNLSIVNNNIIENDVEMITDNESLKIQDPEPLIIVPENLAPFIPRTTNFLTKYKQTDLNFDAYRRYKNIMSDVLIDINKIQELQNSKAGIGRTLKQLKILYENNDIDINNFTELYEKYSIKLETIENAIRNLKNPKKRAKMSEEQKEILKTIM